MKELQLDDVIVVEDYAGTQFVRSGGCTAGGGACCEYMVLPLSRTEPMIHTGVGYIVQLDERMAHLPLARFNDVVLWASYHDVYITRDLQCSILTHDIVVSETGDWKACRINLACKKLDLDAEGDKWCGVFGTDDRPVMCSTTPKLPLDIQGLEDICTYSWE